MEIIVFISIIIVDFLSQYSKFEKIGDMLEQISNLFHDLTMTLGWANTNIL